MPSEIGAFLTLCTPKYIEYLQLQFLEMSCGTQTTAFLMEVFPFLSYSYFENGAGVGSLQSQFLLVFPKCCVKKAASASRSNALLNFAVSLWSLMWSDLGTSFPLEEQSTDVTRYLRNEGF